MVEPAALPTVIAGYFAAVVARDLKALVDCFTEDAEVTDEGQTMHGRAEIRQWRETGAASIYEYTIDVLGADALGEDHFLVRTRLEGNFPGGTADLAHDFTLGDGLISRLVIA